MVYKHIMHLKSLEIEVMFVCVRREGSVCVCVYNFIFVFSLSFSKDLNPPLSSEYKIVEEFSSEPDFRVRAWALQNSAKAYPSSHLL